MTNTSSFQPRESTRRDLLELAAGYAEESVIVTASDMAPPGPEIVYVNTAFTRMTGYSAAEVIGKSPRFLQGPATDRRSLDELKHRLAAGEDYIARTTNYRRDGSPFELEWIIKHLRNDEGHTTHYVAVQRDITGVQRAETALAEIDEELRELGAQMVEAVERLADAERKAGAAQRMASLGRMARGMSHDLTNSLVPMSLILDVVESEGGLDASMHERVKLLRANLDHALSLTRRVSEFAGSNVDQQSHVRLEVKRVIDEVVQLTTVQRSRPGPGVSVEVAVADGLEIVVDPVEFRQVLVNLAINAIDAMPDGGTIAFRANESSGQVLVEVADTGHGMDQAAIEHCFEPFFTTNEVGHGLGLSICHGVIDRIGGTIDVQSEVGTGTTFSIRVPAPTASD